MNPRRKLFKLLLILFSLLLLLSCKEGEAPPTLEDPDENLIESIEIKIKNSSATGVHVPGFNQIPSNKKIYLELYGIMSNGTRQLLKKDELIKWKFTKEEIQQDRTTSQPGYSVFEFNKDTSDDSEEIFVTASYGPSYETNSKLLTTGEKLGIVIPHVVKMTLERPTRQRCNPSNIRQFENSINSQCQVGKYLNGTDNAPSPEDSYYKGVAYLSNDTTADVLDYCKEKNGIKISWKARSETQNRVIFKYPDTEGQCDIIEGNNLGDITLYLHAEQKKGKKSLKSEDEWPLNVSGGYLKDVYFRPGEEDIEKDRNTLRIPEGGKSLMSLFGILSTETTIQDSDSGSEVTKQDSEKLDLEQRNFNDVEFCLNYLPEESKISDLQYTWAEKGSAQIWGGCLKNNAEGNNKDNNVGVVKGCYGVEMDDTSDPASKDVVHVADVIYNGGADFVVQGKEEGTCYYRVGFKDKGLGNNSQNEEVRFNTVEIEVTEGDLESVDIMSNDIKVHRDLLIPLKNSPLTPEDKKVAESFTFRAAMKSGKGLAYEYDIFKSDSLKKEDGETPWNASNDRDTQDAGSDKKEHTTKVWVTLSDESKNDGFLSVDKCVDQRIKVIDASNDIFGLDLIPKRPCHLKINAYYLRIKADPNKPWLENQDETSDISFIITPPELDASVDLTFESVTTEDGNRYDSDKPIPIGVFAQLRAIATRTDDSTEDVTNLATWTSDNTNMITVGDKSRPYEDNEEGSLSDTEQKYIPPGRITAKDGGTNKVKIKASYTEENPTDHSSKTVTGIFEIGVADRQLLEVQPVLKTGESAETEKTTGNLLIGNNSYKIELRGEFTDALDVYIPLGIEGLKYATSDKCEDVQTDRENDIETGYWVWCYPANLVTHNLDDAKKDWFKTNDLPGEGMITGKVWSKYWKKDIKFELPIVVEAPVLDKLLIVDTTKQEYDVDNPIDISETGLNIPLGGSKQLRVIATYTSSYFQNEDVTSAVIWNTDAPDVVEVATGGPGNIKNGLITATADDAKKGQSAEISVKLRLKQGGVESKDHTVKNKITVTVTEPVQTGIRLELEKDYLAAGQDINFTLYKVFSDDERTTEISDYDQISWKGLSSKEGDTKESGIENETKVEITGNTIEAIDSSVTGKLEITAKHGIYETTAILFVTDGIINETHANTGIVGNQEELNDFQIGRTINLTANAQFTDLEKKPADSEGEDVVSDLTSTAIWRFAKDSKCTTECVILGPNGTLTALNRGTVTIEVVYPDRYETTKRITINVLDRVVNKYVIVAGDPVMTADQLKRIDRYSDIRSDFTLSFDKDKQFHILRIYDFAATELVKGDELKNFKWTVTDGEEHGVVLGKASVPAQDGLLKPSEVGQVTLNIEITDNDGGKKTAKAKVDIYASILKGITISHVRSGDSFSQPYSPLPAGRTLQLYATAVYTDENKEKEDITSLVTWEPAGNTFFEKPGLLKVEKDNTKSETIRVWVSLWGKRAPVDVSITKAEMDKINLAPPALIVDQGKDATFTIAPTDTNDHIYDMETRSIQWSFVNGEMAMPDNCENNTTCTFSTKTLPRGEPYRIRVFLSDENSYYTDTTADAMLLVGHEELTTLEIIVPESYESIPKNRSLQLQAFATFSNGMKWNVTRQVVWEVDDDCASFPENKGLLSLSNDCNVGANFSITATLDYNDKNTDTTEELSTNNTQITVAEAEYDHIVISPYVLDMNAGKFTADMLVVKRYDSTMEDPRDITDDTDLTWSIQKENGENIDVASGSLVQEINVLPEGIHTLKVEVPDEERYQCRFMPSTCKRDAYAKLVVTNGILESLKIHVNDVEANSQVEIEEGKKLELKVTGEFSAPQSTITTFDMTDVVRWRITPAACANIVQEDGKQFIRAIDQAYNSDSTWKTNCSNVTLTADFNYGDSQGTTAAMFKVTKRSTIKGYRIDKGNDSIRLGDSKSFTLYNEYDYSNVLDDKTESNEIRWELVPTGKVEGKARITTTDGGNGNHTVTVKADDQVGAVGELNLNAFIGNDKVASSLIRIFSAAPEYLKISHDKLGDTFTQPNGTLPAGRALQLYATAFYPDRDPEDVTSLATWTSGGDTEISSGLLKTKLSNAENTNITVSVELWGKDASTDVTIAKTEMDTINPDPIALQVNQGEDATFTIEPKNTDGSLINMTNYAGRIQWSFDKGQIDLSKECPGTVTCTFSTKTLARGVSYKVTVSLPDENASYTKTETEMTLFVGDEELTGLEIEVPAGYGTVPKSRDLQLQAFATFSNNTRWNVTRQVTWEEDNSCSGISNGFESTGVSQSAGVLTLGSNCNVDDTIKVTATLQYNGQTTTNAVVATDDAMVTVGDAEYDHIVITPDVLNINAGEFSASMLKAELFDSTKGTPDTITNEDFLIWAIQKEGDATYTNISGTLVDAINDLPEGIHILRAEVPDEPNYQCRFLAAACNRFAYAKLVVKNGILKGLTIHVNGSKATEKIEIEEGNAYELKVTGTFSADQSTITSFDMTDVVRWAVSPAICANVIQKDGKQLIQAHNQVFNSNGTTIHECQNVTLTADFHYGDSAGSTTASFNVAKRSTIAGYRIESTKNSIQLGTDQNFTLYNIYNYSNVLDDKTDSDAIRWELIPTGSVQGKANITTANGGNGAHTVTLLAETVGQVTLKASVNNVEVATTLVQLFSEPPEALEIAHQRLGQTLTQTKGALPAGKSLQLYATARNANGSVVDVTSLVSWESTGNTTMPEPGLLTVNSGNTYSGDINVTVKLWGREQTRSVTIAGAVMASINLSDSALQVNQGEDAIFTIAPVNTNGAAMAVNDFTGNNVTIRWNLENGPNLADCTNTFSCTIPTTNLPRGASYKLTVSFENQDANYVTTTADATLFVGDEELTGLEVKIPAGYESVPAGRSVQLQAVASFSNGTQWNVTRQATWSDASTCANVSDSEATKGLLELNTSCSSGTIPVTATLRYNSPNNTANTQVASDTRNVTAISAEFDHLVITPDLLNINAGRYEAGMFKVNQYDSANSNPDEITTGLTWSIQKESENSFTNISDSLVNSINALPEGIHTLRVTVADGNTFACKLADSTCDRTATARVVVKDGTLETLTVLVDNNEAIGTIAIEEGDKKELKVTGAFSVTNISDITNMDMTDLMEWSTSPQGCINIIWENGKYWVQAENRVFNSNGTPIVTCSNVALTARFNYGDSSGSKSANFNVTKRSTIAGYRIESTKNSIQLGTDQSFTLYNIYNYSNVSDDKTDSDAIRWESVPTGSVQGKASITTANGGNGAHTVTLLSETVGQVTLKAFVNNVEVATTLVQLFSEPPAALEISHQRLAQSFSQTKGSLPAGKTLQLYATARNANGTVVDVTSLVSWESTGNTTLPEPGLLTVNSGNTYSGDINVTVKLWGKEKTRSVAITGPVMASINLSDSALLVNQGEDATFTIAPVNTNGVAMVVNDFTGNNVTIKWSLANGPDLSGCTNIFSCTIPTTSLPRGASYKLTVSFEGLDANYVTTTANATLFVGDEELTGLEVKIPAGYESVPAGRSVQLQAVATFSNGTQWDVTRQATWSDTSTCANVSDSEATKGLLQLETNCRSGAIPVTATLRYNSPNNTANTQVASDTKSVTATSAEFDYLVISSDLLNIGAGRYEAGMFKVYQFDSAKSGATEITNGLTWSIQKESENSFTNISDSLVNSINALPEGIHTLKVTVASSNTFACKLADSTCDRTATARVVVKDGTLETLTVLVDNNKAIGTIAIEEGDKKELKVTGAFSVTNISDITNMDMTDLVQWSSSSSNCIDIIREDGKYWVQAASHVFKSDGSPLTPCTNVTVTAAFQYGDSTGSKTANFNVTQRSTIIGYKISPSNTALSLNDSDIPFTVYNVYQYSSVATDSPANGTVAWSIENSPGAPVIGTVSTDNSTNATLLVTPISEGKVQLRARVNNDSAKDTTAEVLIYSSFLNTINIELVDGSKMVNAKLPAGRSLTLRAVATFGDDPDATADVTRMVTWETPGKAKIVSGVVTADSNTTEGEIAEVTATLRNKTSDKYTVNLTDPVYDTIAFTESNFTQTVERGNLLDFDVTLKKSNGDKYSCGGDVIRWTAASGEEGKYSSASTDTCSGSGGDYQCSVDTGSNDLPVGKYTLDIVCADDVTVTNKFYYIVTDQVVKSIKVSKPTDGFSVPIGRNYQLRAEVTYTDDSTADVTSMVNWSSSNDAVAFITDLGLFQANTIGAVTVGVALGSATNSINLNAITAEYDRIEVKLTSMTANASAFNIDSLSVLKYDSTGDSISAPITDFQWSILSVENSMTKMSDNDNAESWTTAVGLQNAINDQPKGVYALQATGIDGGVYGCTFSECSNVGSTYLVIESGSLNGLIITANDTSDDSTPLQIQEGESFELKAQATYSEGSQLNVERIVSWTVTQPNKIKDVECAKVVHEANRVALIATNDQGNESCEFTLEGKYENATSNKISFEVIKRVLTGYRIDPAQHVMTLGETQSFNVYKEYEFSSVSTDLATDPVKWTIETTTGDATVDTNNETATISVTPLAEGSVSLKATVGEKEATGNITIFASTINGVVVKLADAADPVLEDGKLPAGRALQLQAVATFETGVTDATGDITDLVTWNWTPESNLSMATAGLVTAAQDVVVDETADVIATLRGIESSSFRINFQSPVFEQMAVQKEASAVTETVKKGESISFTIELTDSVGAQFTCPDGQMNWISTIGDFKAGSANCTESAGKYTCAINTGTEELGTGRYQVKAYCGNDSNTEMSTLVDFIVTDKQAKSVAIIDLPDSSEVPMGRSWQLGAEVTYTDDTTADVTSMVDWSSQETGIGIVSKLGNFNAASDSSGDVFIRANFGADVSGDVTIKVTDAEFDHITITSDPLLVYPGEFDRANLLVQRVDSANSAVDVSDDLFSWSITDSSSDVSGDQLTTAINHLSEGVYTITAQVPDDAAYQCPFGNSGCKSSDTAALIIKKDLSKLSGTLTICQAADCDNDPITEYTADVPLTITRGDATTDLSAIYKLENLNPANVAKSAKWTILSTGATASKISLTDEGIISGVSATDDGETIQLQAQYNDVTADTFIKVVHPTYQKLCIKPDPQDVSGDWMVQSATKQWQAVTLKVWGTDNADAADCSYTGGDEWLDLGDSVTWRITPSDDATADNGKVTVTNKTITASSLVVGAKYNENNDISTDITLSLQKIDDLSFTNQKIYLPIDQTIDLDGIKVEKLFNTGESVAIDHGDISWRVDNNSDNVTLDVDGNRLTGNALGTVTLVAYLNDDNTIDATADVRVVPVIRSIRISDTTTDVAANVENFEILRGKTERLYAIASYSNSTSDQEDISNIVKWEVHTDDSADVEVQNGFVKALYNDNSSKSVSIRASYHGQESAYVPILLDDLSGDTAELTITPETKTVEVNKVATFELGLIDKTTRASLDVNLGSIVWDFDTDNLDSTPDAANDSIKLSSESIGSYQVDVSADGFTGQATLTVTAAAITDYKVLCAESNLQADQTGDLMLYQSGVNSWETSLKAWGTTVESSDCQSGFTGSDWVNISNEIDWSVDPSSDHSSDVFISNGSLTVAEGKIPTGTVKVVLAYPKGGEDTTTDVGIRFQNIDKLALKSDHFSVPVGQEISLAEIGVDKVFNFGENQSLAQDDFTWTIDTNASGDATTDLIDYTDGVITGNLAGSVTLRAVPNDSSIEDATADLEIVSTIRNIFITDSPSDVTSDITEFTIRSGESKQLYAVAIYSTNPWKREDVSDIVTWAAEEDPSSDLSFNQGVITLKHGADSRTLKISADYFGIIKSKIVDIQTTKSMFAKLCIEHDLVETRNDETGDYHKVYQSSTNRWPTVPFQLYGSTESTDCTDANLNRIDLSDRTDVTWDVKPVDDVSWDASAHTLDISNDQFGANEFVTIQAYATDASPDATADVRLKYQRITDLSLEKETFNLLLGQEITLAEIGVEKVFNFGDNVAPNRSEIVWAIEGESSADYVTLNDGVVLGIKAGTVTLKATLNDSTADATADIKIVPAIHEIRLTESMDSSADITTDINLMAGTSKQLYVLAVYSTNPYIADYLPNDKVTWSSNAETDVSADSGLLKALTGNTTGTITASYLDVFNAVTVNVTEAEIKQLCVTPYVSDGTLEASGDSTYKVNQGSTNQWAEINFTVWGKDVTDDCANAGDGGWLDLSDSADVSWDIDPSSDVIWNGETYTMDITNDSYLTTDLISVKVSSDASADVSADVQFSYQKVTNLSLESSGFNLPVGQTISLAEIGVEKVFNFGNNLSLATDEFTWSVAGESSSDYISFNDEMGTIQGLKWGSVTLKATLNDSSADATADIKIVPAIQEILISDTTTDVVSDVSDFEIRRGEKKRLYAIAVYSSDLDLKEDISDRVTWDSTDFNDVTADGGLLTALLKENAEDQSSDITVSFLNVTKTVTINVRQPELQTVCVAPAATLALDQSTDASGDFYLVPQSGTNQWAATSFDVWGSDQSADCFNETFSWLDLSDSRDITWDVDPSNDVVWDSEAYTVDITDDTWPTLEFATLKVGSDSSADVSADVRLKFQKLTDIVVTGSGVDLPVGQEISLAEIGVEKVFDFGDNVSLDNAEITWSIEGDNSTDLLSYNEAEKTVRGLSYGELTLKATLTGTALEATTDIRMTSILQSIRLTDSLDSSDDATADITLIKGEKLKLYPLAIYSLADPYLAERITETEVSWSSTNPNDVTADSNGITAIQAGTATVTASWRGMSRAINIAVQEIVDSSANMELRITLDPSSDTLKVGESMNLSAGLFNKNNDQEITLSGAEIGWTLDGMKVSGDVTTDIWELTVFGQDASDNAYTITVDVSADSVHFTQTASLTVAKPSIGRVDVTPSIEMMDVDSSADTKTFRAIIEEEGTSADLTGTLIGSIKWFINNEWVEDETGDSIAINDARISDINTGTVIPIHFTISGENFDSTADLNTDSTGDVISDPGYLFKNY